MQCAERIDARALTMRPRGEIRQTLNDALAELAPCGWRDLLPVVAVDTRSPAEVRLVRRTFENMVQAGDAVRVGSHKAAGSRVYEAMYEPGVGARSPATDDDASAGLDALASVTRSWATFD